MDQKPEQVVQQLSQTEIQPQELDVPHKVHHFITRKTLILMLAFLVIVILSAVGMYLVANKAEEVNPELTKKPVTATNTKEITSEWETYTKFSKYIVFDYPKNWHVNDVKDADPTFYYAFFTSMENTECVKPESKCDAIYMFIFPNSMNNNKVKRDYIKIKNMKVNTPITTTKEFAEIGIVNSTTTRKEDVLLDNYPALHYVKQGKIKNNPSSNDTTFIIELELNDNHYKFHFNSEKVMNKFIKTIKLANPPQYETSTLEDILKQVIATYPATVLWGDIKPLALTYSDFTGDGKTQNVSGIEIKGTDKKLAGSSSKLENSTYLSANQWKNDMNQAADGPIGSGWGYIRNINGKKQVIQLLRTDIEENVTEYSVFVSEPFLME